MLRVTLALLGLVSFAISSAYADTTRTCNASISVGIPTGAGPKASEVIATILGRGACANSVWANRCRERARDFIDECRAAIWNQRFDTSIPQACLSMAGTRPGAKLTYEGIIQAPTPNQFFSRVIFSACCRLRPDASSVTVNVYGSIWGDKKCGARYGAGQYRTDFDISPVGIDCKYWARDMCR